MSTAPASSPTAPVAALVQMTSGIDPDTNLATIDRAMSEAAAGGAVMAFLPEMSLLLDRDRARSAVHIAREADSPWPAALQAMAQKHGLWLHSGSMPLLADDSQRRVNRSHIIAADGSIRARYDKIHMFDVTLPSGENWTESAAYAGGGAVAVVETPLGQLGLSICYDLRFPRALSGADRPRRDSHRNSRCLHRVDGRGALARADAGARDRNGLPCHRRSAVGHTRRRARNLWPQLGGRPMGRGAVGRGNRVRNGRSQVQAELCADRGCRSRSCAAGDTAGPIAGEQEHQPIDIQARTAPVQAGVASIPQMHSGPRA